MEERKKHEKSAAICEQKVSSAEEDERMAGEYVEDNKRCNGECSKMFLVENRSGSLEHVGCLSETG